MALGLARVRNWGREAQEGALALALARGRLTYQVRSAGRGAALDERLFPVASFNRVPLPFTEAVAALIHKGRGRWEGQSLWDGRVRATGVSHRDVIRATIEAVWH